LQPELAQAGGQALRERAATERAEATTETATPLAVPVVSLPEPAGTGRPRRGRVSTGRRLQLRDAPLLPTHPSKYIERQEISDF
jgi:hypothetical protein